MPDSPFEYDVLIIGGGPAGSSVGSLLRRYNPSLKILIVEREIFPRDHIGESQLPAVCKVLHEMGAWDKVESAGFPIKVGSTYRWGKTNELWQVNFLPEEIRDDPRPARFEGQRARTAFQVDRSIYDKILLDHAEELGCQVLQNTRVIKVDTDGDTVVSVAIGPSEAPQTSPQTVHARYYVDASGGSGILRRALNVEVDSPTSLRNIALWDYWQDARWAETVGCSGTRAQIMSLGWGWLWFIPITSTRTSIGLVTPAQYLKECGMAPEDLYLKGVGEEPRISALVTDAKREGRFQATRDWSYIAQRLAGDNWFLCGDACGFADPILSAGMTLAQVSARKVAYTILELDRMGQDPEWLKSEYSRTHRSNVRQHIRFAEYWYSANERFTELQSYCRSIAEDAGLGLTPEAAFQWISTGGFASDTLAEEEANIFSFRTAKIIAGRFAGSPLDWKIARCNQFKLNLVGATRSKMAFYGGGRVSATDCLQRGAKLLPLIGHAQLVYSVLRFESDAVTAAKMLQGKIDANRALFPDPDTAFAKTMEVLETMIADGWVTAKVNKKRPFIVLEG